MIKFIGIVLAFIAVILLIVFWPQIKTFFSGGTASTEGDPCTDSNGNPSTIQNGVCKEVIRPPVNVDVNRVWAPYTYPYPYVFNHNGPRARLINGYYYL